jgi:hypothetical protein
MPAQLLPKRPPRWHLLTRPWSCLPSSQQVRLRCPLRTRMPWHLEIQRWMQPTMQPLSLPLSLPLMKPQMLPTMQQRVQPMMQPPLKLRWVLTGLTPTEPRRPRMKPKAPPNRPLPLKPGKRHRFGSAWLLGHRSRRLRLQRHSAHRAPQPQRWCQHLTRLRWRRGRLLWRHLPQVRQRQRSLARTTSA